MIKAVKAKKEAKKKGKEDTSTAWEPERIRMTVLDSPVSFADQMLKRILPGIYSR